ncbi:MAG: hypothetical protein QXT20_01920 [Candidatus Woesearchaeota archaeon]
MKYKMEAEPKNFSVKPSPFLSLASAISKLILFLAICWFFLMIFKYSAGEDTISMLLETFSLDLNLIRTTVLQLFVVASVIYIVYSVLSVNQISLEIGRGVLIYKRGILLVKKDVVSSDNVVRIYSDSSKFSSMGKLILELSGQLPFIEIPFVPMVNKKVELIKQKISEAQAEELARRIYDIGRGQIGIEIAQKISRLISVQQASKESIVSEIKNISSQQKLDKDVFEVIFSYMLKTHRITKDEVKEILSELMRSGVISQQDASVVLFKINNLLTP